MEHSFYIYSLSVCQKLTFVGDDAFIASLKGALSVIRYEEGCGQFGRAVFHPGLLQQLEDFANDHFAACNKIKSLPAYFRRLNEGDYFYIVDSNFPTINRQIALVWLRAHNMGLNTRNAWNQYLKTHGLLKSRFDYYSFGFDDVKFYAGEKEKDNRTCRFCHGVTQENPLAGELTAKGYSIVKFGKPDNAHAISDALGNKILFCLEECTTCNGELSRVENNLIALMDWRRALLGIKTKSNDIPNVFGEEAVLRVDEQGNQILYVDEAVAQPIAGKEILKIRLNNKKTITDQGVCKALYKYAINLMPQKYLSHFAQTIDLICGRINEVELPEIQVAYKMPFVMQPILDLYFNKSGNLDTPLCTAILHVCDISYLYILPLADTDGARFKAKGSLTPHWEQFHNAMPAYWKSEDMSNYRPSSPWIDIELPLNYPKIKIVPHDDPMLRQPVSTPKNGAKVKERRVEHLFPPFDVNSVMFKGVDVTKFNVLYTGQMPADALHNATVVVDGINCTIDLDSNTAAIQSSFTVKDPTGNIPYFDFGFVSHFELSGADKYISITDELLALDYNLRDTLFYIGCIGAQSKFKKCVQGTPFAICSLPKTLCDDERTVLQMQYRLKTVHRTCLFKDSDIHNNPFNI